MGRQIKWAGDYVSVTSQGGILLLRQLDNFIRVCLQLYCKQPQQESVYVMALRDSCPDPSNLHTLLRDKRPDLDGKSPIERALEIAEEEYAAYRLKLESGEINTGRPNHMAEVIKDYYPEFEPDDDMMVAILEL